MKKYIAIAAFALFTMPAMAQEYNPETPYEVRSYSSNNIDKVEASTYGGNISLQSVDNAQARIEVYIWPNNNRGKQITKEEIQKRLQDNYTLTYEVNGNTLKAVAKKKSAFRDWKHALNISFRIFLPKNASSILRTSGGNVSIVGMTGTSQDFSTSGGNLDVQDVAGKISGKTSGGNIHVKNASDDINLSTSGGNIAAEKVKGQVHLSTSGGNLSLTDLDGTITATTSGGSVDAQRIDGSLSAKTSGGNIDLSDLSCSIDASTSGGGIDVQLKKLGKFVTLRNSGGNISLKMPSDAGVDLKLHADRVKINEMKNFNGTTEEHRIEGKLNGGGVPVTVDDGSGNIVITLQ